MKLGLHVVRINDFKHYSVRRQLRFAIVNLDKPGTYPSNFVCMLPLHIDPLKMPCAFVRIFGPESSELAKRLLTEALKKERDSEVRVEIERRLRLVKSKNS